MGMDTTATLAVAILVAALAGTVYLVVSSRGRRAITTPEQRATHDVLHRAGLAAEPLRLGLDPTTAARRTVSTGRTAILRQRDLPCDIVDCAVRGAVVAPLASRIPSGGDGAA